MRCLPYLLVALSLAGCHNQGTPVANPFLAPDRVPPPSTRTPLPGTAQPYYPGDPVPGAVTGPVTPAPAYAPPPAGQPVYTPESAPVTPQPNPWGQPAPVTTPYGVQPTSAVTPVNHDIVDGQVVSVAPDNQNPRFAPISSQSNDSPTNDIVQIAAQQQMAQNAYIYNQPQTVPSGGQTILPPAQNSRSAFVTPVLPSNVPQDGFRPQGSSRPNTDASVDRPATQAQSDLFGNPSPNYGYDATYTWLRGQLQYFPQSGVWGIRYIDPQGPPDAMGGVVVIDNPEVLGGLQPGEFLLVQGYFEQVDNGDGSFTPLYTVSGIQRQQ